jgi:hypothetical protein
MTTPGPDFSVRAAIREVLADGEWHLTTEIHDLVMRKVPPGIAARHARKNQPGLSMDDAVRSGQRTIAREGLLSCRQGNITETDPPYGPIVAQGAKVRLSPITLEIMRTISIDEVARLLGTHHNTLRGQLERGIVDVRLIETRMGLRMYPDDIPALTTFMARYQRGRLTMRWARYNVDFDALWNRRANTWELVDGQPVTRKHVDASDVVAEDEDDE